jgi:ParB/RepB/Spo0J family partition protein
MKTPKLPDGTKVDLNLGQVVEDPTTQRGEPEARHVADPDEYFARLKDLAGSMNDAGLLQPILVREVEGGFVVVCGRRRLAAARYLGWETIPAIIRQMTDEQAAVAELLENLQRADLDPLDEAAAYKRLADTGHSVAEIAAMVHRAPSTVAGRLALLDLPGAALDAIREGRLSMAVAGEIARLPGQQQREEATDDIIDEAYQVREESGHFNNPDPSDDESDDEDDAAEAAAYKWEPISLSEARRLIRDKYMTSLAGAPFDVNDAGLVEAAGSCAACPRRTGNAVDLFGDLLAGPRGQDICTYGPCFQAKREAHVERLLAGAREAGLAILPATQVAKAFAGSALISGKWVDADATARNPVTGNLLKQTWRKALGKKAPQEMAAVVPATGKLVSLYSRKAAEAVLREKYAKPGDDDQGAGGVAGQAGPKGPAAKRRAVDADRIDAAVGRALGLVVPDSMHQKTKQLDVVLELMRIALIAEPGGGGMDIGDSDVLERYRTREDLEAHLANVTANAGDIGIIRIFAGLVLRYHLERAFRGARDEDIMIRVERLAGRHLHEILADVDRDLEAAAAGGE